MLRARSLLLCLALVTALPPVCADASAGPPQPVPPRSGPAVFGEALLRDADVTVTCTGSAAPLACTVRATFVLVAVEEVRVEQGNGTLTPGTSVRIEGDELGATGRTVPAGETVHVALEQTRQLAVHDTWRETFWAIDPMLARHPLLGESEEIEHRSDELQAVLATGSHLTMEGTVHVDARRSGGASVQVGGVQVTGVADVPATSPTVDVGIAPPGPVPLVRQGGPLLALGARFDLAVPNDGGRFFLRAGYELGMTEWLFGSATFETDFESIMESLVVEAATPELLLVVPSVAGGIGVVARQLGRRDADAAVRLRLGLNVVGLGVTADFDYWPAIGTWTGTVAVRVSI